MQLTVKACSWRMGLKPPSRSAANLTVFWPCRVYSAPRQRPSTEVATLQLARVGGSGQRLADMTGGSQRMGVRDITNTSEFGE